MSRKLDCLGLGIAPADILMGIDRYPKPGEKIDANAMIMQGGGPVPTAMVTLARLGMKAGLLAPIGDDIMGQFVKDELRAEKVDSSLMVIKSKPTAVASGWFEKGSGRRTIILDLDIELTEKDILLKRLPTVRSVHLDGRYMSASLKLARWAKRNGAIVSLDVGSMRDSVARLFPLVDHLVCADAFAIPFTHCRKPENALQKLKKMGPDTVVITYGTKGSYGFSDTDGLVYQKAYKVISVDTTGAGDVYHGAYIFGMLNGYTLPQKMQFASAAAALKCTKPGGRTGIASLQRTLAFIRKGG